MTSVSPEEEPTISTVEPLPGGRIGNFLLSQCIGVFCGWERLKTRNQYRHQGDVARKKAYIYEAEQRDTECGLAYFRAGCEYFSGDDFKGAVKCLDKARPVMEDLSRTGNYQSMVDLSTLYYKLECGYHQTKNPKGVLEIQEAARLHAEVLWRNFGDSLDYTTPGDLC